MVSDSSSPSERSDGYRALWAVRTARLYLVGQTISMFGDNALAIAIAVRAQTLADSPSAAGLIVFVFALPQLFAPAAGVAVDRYDRRRFLLTVNLVAAVLVLPLVLVDARAS